MPRATKPKLNIIIPAYNEENRILATLMSLDELLYGRKLLNKYDSYVYIVDDGSMDNTTSVATRLLKKLNVPFKIFSYKKNRGKGYAIKYGVLNSRKADYYYTADADMSANWSTLIRFLKEMKKDDYDVVIGSRALDRRKVKTTISKLIMGRIGNFVINAFLGLNYADTQCGYKLFNANATEAFKLQKLNKWGFDFEILYILKKLKLTTKELAIKWEHKKKSRVKVLDYLRTFLDLVKVKVGRYKINVQAN